jgi:putative oxidoreductase
MKEKLPIITRYLMGLLFFVFGGAGLFNLIPPPPDLPEAMQTFMAGMMATKYFFPLLKLTETACGILLLLGIAPALALIILAPITINIVLVHWFLTPGLENLVIPTAILALHGISATYYWPIYAPLFKKFKR